MDAVTERFASRRAAPVVLVSMPWSSCTGGSGWAAPDAGAAEVKPYAVVVAVEYG
ncbi:hypothetical protein [Streptomyces fuscigenes]|uniref:hypothetical protein n=1 Tax=Streptomyces fuscigenes TaxID=1528880 RepID=UPI001F455125|nr:hypothetical protein [Streptomyces fuscigenes]MCF3961189.1 hypothetical protein [Streptomyces fuscigenes]